MTSLCPSPQIAPVAAQALQALADRLMRVCENPQQPGFNHFLFEAVAALIRYGCEADPAMVVRFEASLFPAFEKVLQVRGSCSEATERCPHQQMLVASLNMLVVASGEVRRFLWQASLLST